MSPLPLRPYQIEDLAFLIANPRACLLHDPGCGKTPPVCVWIEWRWTQDRERTVWVMPKSLFAKNRDELLRFTNLRPEQIVIVDGPKARERLRDPAAVCLIMGPDRFKLCAEELDSSVRNLVADELHLYWSTNKSQRVQSWYRAMRKIPRFVGMTGTLISGRLDSAYPTIHVIEPRYYAGFQDFMNRHALTDDYGTVLGWHDTKRIAEIIGRHAIRRSFADVYGPEAKVIITETCPMSPKQREAYEEFEAKAIIELENEFLDAPTGGVFALRCRQIMAHPETWDLTKGEPTGKDDLLDIHLANHANTGEPLVIYACFVPEQERIVRNVHRLPVLAVHPRDDAAGRS